MSSLRDIVRRHVEEQSLRSFLADNYDDTPKEEKTRLLDLLRQRGEIDREVEQILRPYREELENDSPLKAKRRNWKIAFVIINAILTPGIAYAVNEKAWVFTTILSVVLVFFSIIFILFGEE